MRKITAAVFFCLIVFSSTSKALTESEKQYLNEMEYKRSRLEILVKKRFVSERNNYSNTDFYSTTYTQESYSQTWGNANTYSGERAETKEISNWVIVKGGLRELSDSEFLETIGNQKEAETIRAKEETKSQYRMYGNITSLLGIGYMLLSSANNNSSQSVAVGGLVTVIGFFVSAFNSPQRHYLQPDYVQQEADNYNTNLKIKLGLPITYN